MSTGKLYTCIGKGGTYELLGVATGAGTCKGDEAFLMVYREVEYGSMYYRTIDDFAERMKPIKTTEGT